MAKNRNRSNAQIGKPHPHKGYKAEDGHICSFETRRKISASLKGRKLSVKHVNKLRKAKRYKRKKTTTTGGTKTKPWHKRIQHWVIYKEWRFVVLERDGFACVSCGKVGGLLDVHHIIGTKDMPDLAFEISNGATLCKSCHKNVHEGNIKLMTA